MCALSFVDVKSGVAGDLRYRVMDVTFDSSYPTGGESLTPADLGMDSIIELKARSTTAGYDFSYDTTNHKLKTFRVAPGLVVEETITVTTNVGTLANIPAYIVGVTKDANTAKHVIPAGLTPAAGQVSVNFTTGTLTFAAADSVTTAKVTYFPKKAGTIFANPTVDELATLATGTFDLAARAAMIQYIYNSTDGSLPALDTNGATPASGHLAIDIINSTKTTVTGNAAQNGKVYKVTYIPFSALPDTSMLLDDPDIAATFEPYLFTGTGGYNGLVVPAVGTHILGKVNAGPAYVDLKLGGPSVTPANNAMSKWEPALNTVTVAQTTNLDHVIMPWVVLYPGQTQSALMEVPSATDLSAIVVRMFVLGW